MQQSPKKNGGAREGAGRPPLEEPKKNRSLRATDKQWATFQALGGNALFCAMLDLIGKDAKKP